MGWTDGTGMNENGLCIDSRLTKFSDDVTFDDDNQNFVDPWQMHTTAIDWVHLCFQPFYKWVAKTDALVIYSEVHPMVRRFSGTIQGDKGYPITIENATGWAEDHNARW